MEFKYGISPESLARWLAFRRILAVREERGAEAGQGALKAIVDAELDAIESATLEYALREAEASRGAEPLPVRRAAGGLFRSGAV